MEPFHVILIVLYLLVTIILLRKIRYIRKAEEKAVISVINKKRAVLIAAATVIYIVFIIFLFKIFGFDIKELLDIILESFPLLLLLTEGFCCITPDGIVGDSLTNKGLEPKENFSYRFTFKGRHQTECLEIYSRGQKKPRTYYGGIKNDELIKILEENYEPYIKDDYAHHD